MAHDIMLTLLLASLCCLLFCLGFCGVSSRDLLTEFDLIRKCFVISLDLTSFLGSVLYSALLSTHQAIVNINIFKMSWQLHFPLPDPWKSNGKSVVLFPKTDFQSLLFTFRKLGFLSP